VADSSCPAMPFPHFATSFGSLPAAALGLVHGNVFDLVATTTSVIATLMCFVLVASSNFPARGSPSFTAPTDSDSSSVADIHTFATRFVHFATFSGVDPFAFLEAAANFHSLGMLSFAVLRRVFGCAPVATSLGGVGQSLFGVFAGTFGDIFDVTVSDSFCCFCSFADGSVDPSP